MTDPLAIRRDHRRRNLDRRIVRLERTQTRNDDGTSTTTYVEHPGLWAKRFDPDDSIVVEGQDALRTRTTIEYLVRFGPWVVLDRLRDETRVVSVRSIEEIERRRWLLLQTEIVSG